MKKLLLSIALILSAGDTFSAAGSSAGNLISYKWGLSAMQGRRYNMEDTHKAQLDYKGNANQAYFGVYDGHGGRQAAEYTEAHLHENVARLGLTEGFTFTHDEFVKNNPRSGTTVLVAVTEQQPNGKLDLSFAWAGDARGILVDNQNRVIYATEDHKPDEPKEKARIEAAGGFVTTFGVPRVNGILAVARAIGDANVGNGLTAEPDVNKIPLNQNAAYIILACDGVWDVISNEEAAKIVADAFAAESALTKDNAPSAEEEGNNDAAIMAARALRDAAYNKESTDNISVIVVKLDWQQPVQAALVPKPARPTPKIDRRRDLRGRTPLAPNRQLRIPRNARRGRSIAQRPALPATASQPAPHYASPEIEKWTAIFKSTQEQAARAAIQLENVKRSWADQSMPAGFRIASPVEQAARRDRDFGSPGSLTTEQRMQRNIKQAEQRLKMANDSVLYAKEMLDQAHNNSL